MTTSLTSAPAVFSASSALQDDCRDLLILRRRAEQTSDHTDTGALERIGAQARAK